MLIELHETWLAFSLYLILYAILCAMIWIKSLRATHKHSQSKASNTSFHSTESAVKIRTRQRHFFLFTDISNWIYAIRIYVQCAQQTQSRVWNLKKATEKDAIVRINNESMHFCVTDYIFVWLHLIISLRP